MVSLTLIQKFGIYLHLLLFAQQKVDLLGLLLETNNYSLWILNRTLMNLNLSLSWNFCRRIHLIYLHLHRRLYHHHHHLYA